MNDEIKFYIVSILLAIMAIASMASLNVIVIIASFFAAGLLIAFYRLHYIIDSLIFKHSNLVQIVNNFELSNDRTAALRKLDGNFSATAAALLENSSRNGIDREKIENIISNLHFPFKFILQIEYINIKKLLDKIETKRNIKEIELAKIKNSKGNDPKINALKREIEQMERDISQLSTGSPLKISQYLMTSALSENKFSAQERAKGQIRELGSHFSAITGSKLQVLEGNELLDLLEFDSSIVIH